jgi:hypothetical protein
MMISAACADGVVAEASWAAVPLAAMSNAPWLTMIS